MIMDGWTGKRCSCPILAADWVNVSSWYAGILGFPDLNSANSFLFLAGADFKPEHTTKTTAPKAPQPISHGQRATFKVPHPSASNDLFTMHLMYTVDANGKRLYTLHKIVEGEVTKSAHPARFSPDDKYSRYVDPSRGCDDGTAHRTNYAYRCRHRVTLKKRYGLLITQQQSMFPRIYGIEYPLTIIAEDKKVLGQ